MLTATYTFGLKFEMVPGKMAFEATIMASIEVSHLTKIRTIADLFVVCWEDDPEHEGSQRRCLVRLDEKRSAFHAEIIEQCKQALLYDPQHIAGLDEVEARGLGRLSDAENKLIDSWKKAIEKKEQAA